MKRFLFSCGWLAAATLANSAIAQLIEVDVTDSSAWTIVQDDDADATFGFDYSEFGIPAAPGSDDTLGVRLEANIGDGAASAISIVPNGISASGRYRVSVDLWMNYYAHPEKVGTTEFGGVFVGFDTNDAPINGSGLLGSGDGDASVDYRLFGDGELISFDSGQYLVDSQNHTDTIYVEAWPGQEVPTEQLDNFDPPNEFEIAFDGALAWAWHTFSVEVDTSANEALFAIDDIEIGVVSPDLNGGSVSGNIALTYTDLFSSVAPVADFAFGVFDNFQVDIIDGGPLPGDFDGDGELTENDIDLIAEALRVASGDPAFDLDGNGELTAADHLFLISDLMNTWLGDSNLDGEFNSGDFVVTFTAGTYESGQPATWATGDWNGDGQFDTSDFVTAFSNGGYEVGPRPAVAAVPEPATATLSLLGCILLLVCRR